MMVKIKTEALMCKFKWAVVMVFLFAGIATMFVLGHGEIEDQGSCTVEVTGHVIMDSRNKIVGCGSPGSTCTFTLSVPCP